MGRRRVWLQATCVDALAYVDPSWQGYEMCPSGPGQSQELMARSCAPAVSLLLWGKEWGKWEGGHRAERACLCVRDRGRDMPAHKHLLCVTATSARQCIFRRRVCGQRLSLAAYCFFDTARSTTRCIFGRRVSLTAYFNGITANSARPRIWNIGRYQNVLRVQWWPFVRACSAAAAAAATHTYARSFASQPRHAPTPVLLPARPHVRPPEPATAAVLLQVWRRGAARVPHERRDTREGEGAHLVLGIRAEFAQCATRRTLHRHVAYVPHERYDQRDDQRYDQR
eukprot:364422-Chlamydomonas_euryale.AAC.1